MKIILKIS